jgi:hypothetical protein
VTERRYRAPAYNLGESHGSVLLRLIVILDSRNRCNDGHLVFRRLVRPQPNMTAVHSDQKPEVSTLQHVLTCLGILLTVALLIHFS